MTSVQSRIAAHIAREILHLKEGPLPSPDQSLLAEQLLDSLGLQQLITFIEAEFNVSIGDDELLPENFESIRTIAELVERLRG